MAISRMKKRRITQLSKTNEVYKARLEKKDLSFVSIFETAAFSLDDTQKELDFFFREETWKDGDRLYKLSQKHYNSIEFWWVIGVFNQKPTDAHYQAGDLVLIPYPLEDALEFIGVY